MKISRKSWHYKYLSWCLGYPAEKDYSFGNSVLSKGEERDTFSYLCNLFIYILFSPIIIPLQLIFRHKWNNPKIEVVD